MNRVLLQGISGRCYAPQCNLDGLKEEVFLLPEEMAVIDLIDLQGLEQEEAAMKLGVSRKTVWRDIHQARLKIADALIHGKTIRMGGCIRMLEGHCPKLNAELCPKIGGGLCPWLMGGDQDDSGS